MMREKERGGGEERGEERGGRREGGKGDETEGEGESVKRRRFYGT